MQRTKRQKKETAKKAFHWRKSLKKWTDTLFDKRLLTNPSLMTNAELAKALEEHQEWRMGYGKYAWTTDPIKARAEVEPPFSPAVLSNLINETITRLKIGGDLAMGRYKDHV